MIKRVIQFNPLLLFLLASFCATGVFGLELHGEKSPGGILVGKATPGSSIYLNETLIPVNQDGYFVIGFGRDASGEQNVKAVTDGSTKIETFVLAARQYNIQRVDGVPQSTVNPGKEALERIRKEASLVREARKLISPRKDFLNRFIAPATGRITGVYGSQRIYNGEPKRPHYGIDYAGPMGAPVIAPADGVVTLTHDNMYYSGGTLLVDHGNGLSSTFIHLSEILVDVGDEVKQGDTIAKIGAGGRSTGPHLDWRMNWLDQRVDPALMLKVELPEGF